MDNNPPGQPQFTPTPPPTPGPSPFGPAPQPIAPVPPVPAASRPKSGKGIIVAVAIVVAILALAGGGFWWWTTQAQSSYKSAEVSYEQKAKAAYEFYRDSSDTNKDATAITQKFDDALAAKPSAQAIFGWSPVASGDIQHVNQLTTTLSSLRDSFGAYHAFKEYGNKVLEIVGKTSGLVLSTVDDMRTAQTLCAKVATDLKALSVPKGAENFNTTLSKAYETLATDLDTAIKAYDAHDSAGYLSAINKVAADSIETKISDAGKKLTDLYNDIYNKLSKDYDDLANILGE